MPALKAEDRALAESKFHAIFEYYDDPPTPYKNLSYWKLLQNTYQYSRSELSRDNFLRAFFQSIRPPPTDDTTMDKDEELLAPIGTDVKSITFDSRLQEEVKKFAEMLIDCFFLPLKAVGGKTPQPTPAHLSAVRSPQGNHDFHGTPDRLTTLRSLCLTRDKHRCVISLKFDDDEYERREKTSGNGGVKDDEDNLVDEKETDVLQVAHILPHFLAQVDDQSVLSESKRSILSILNMFDCGVSWQFGGAEIDRPDNALTLTPRMHKRFGAFDIYFEPVQNERGAYRIQSFKGARWPLPVTRKFTDGGIHPPSSRLLALHSAIGHILHLSGAGEYIDKILDDFENSSVREDGSTDLDRMVRLRLGGFDGAVDVY